LEIVSNHPKSDTIEFSYLGYKKAKISVNDFMDSNGPTIFLKEKPMEIGEVKVVPKKYTTTIVGIKEKKPWGLQYANIFSGNKGNFLENKKKETGWIKSVSYYLHEDGYPNAPFRVRIYEVDKKNKPGKDLLKENLVVSAKKSGWFTIDVSDYNIAFPKEGVFVMMEWINSGEKFYFEKKIPIKGKNGEPDKIEKRKYYGQSLGTVREKGGVVLWGNNPGNDWIPYDFSYKGTNVNAMINAEIAYEKY
jgi:hypothetical protein